MIEFCACAYGRYRWLLVASVLSILIILTDHVEATPPIGLGRTIEFDSTDNAVSGNTVQMRVAIAVDLDGDGDDDLLTGRESTASNEIRGWENDGTPFTGTWSQVQIGDTGTATNALVVGDLDREGFVDVVGGGTDDNVYIFQGNVTPFGGAWGTTRVIGTAVSPAYSFVGAAAQRRLLSKSVPEWLQIFQQQEIEGVVLVPV